MKKEKLLQLTGNQLPCAPDCQIGHQCFGGYMREEETCDKAINNIQELFKKLGYISLVMVQRFFGIRIFDSSSEVRPLPVIGTILIENGDLKLREE